MRSSVLAFLTIGLLAVSPSLLADQQDLENFLDGGAKKPAATKAVPSGVRVLLAPKTKVWAPVWLPDSRRIVCLSDEPGQPVWVVDAHDGIKVALGQAGPKSSLAVLPDGRLLYVAGKDAQRSIHLLSIGERRETMLGIGWNPAVRGDGKEVVCDTSQGPVVLAVDELQARAIKVPLPGERTAEDSYPRFAGDAVLYAQEGHVYRWDRDSAKPQRIAAQNMQDLTFYQWALPSPDGSRAALFSTNASALSKPPSIWLLSLAGEDRRPLEVCLGQPLQWIGNQGLLILRSGSLCRVSAAAGANADVLLEGIAGATLSPDGKRLALLCVVQDTNADGQINWRDGTSLLLKELP